MNHFSELVLLPCDLPGVTASRALFAPCLSGYRISRTQEVKYWKVLEALSPVGGFECHTFPERSLGSSFMLGLCG